MALAEVSKSGYPDHFALDKKHKYYDPKSEGKPEPTWYMVDIAFKKKFEDVVDACRVERDQGAGGYAGHQARAKAEYSASNQGRV